MGEVIGLPIRERRVWTCACGSYSHLLYDDGTAECAACGALAPDGMFCMPPGEEVPDVEPTAINRRFETTQLARRSFARDLERPDLLGMCLIFEDGRVRSVVTETADTDARRAWWRRRVVSFLRHAFGEVVK